MEHLVNQGCNAGEKFDFRCRFLATDAGRSKSRRARQKNDCSVRAIALVANLKYDDAYDYCAAKGRKCGKGMHLKDWLPETVVNGFRFSWTPFPAVKGKRRVNPVDFANSHDAGRFILRTSKHVLACIDGVVMDTTQFQGPMGLGWRCVYGAWEAKLEDRHDR